MENYGDSGTAGSHFEQRVPPPRCKATWKREFKLPWREAGPPDHHDDTVDSDQKVVNKESLHSPAERPGFLAREHSGAGSYNVKLLPR